jgi:hypothetical protein
MRKDPSTSAVGLGNCQEKCNTCDRKEKGKEAQKTQLQQYMPFHAVVAEVGRDLVACNSALLCIQSQLIETLRGSCCRRLHKGMRYSNWYVFKIKSSKTPLLWPSLTGLPSGTIVDLEPGGN